MGWTKLIDEDDKQIGVVGDSGWDLAGKFIDEMHSLYLRVFGRRATREEILSSVDFAYLDSEDE